MRSILTICLLLVTMVTASTQISLTASYFPEVGDTLSTLQDFDPPALELFSPGGPRTWDFSGLRIVNRYERVATAVAPESGFPNADLRLVGSDGSEAYYRTTADRFELVGFSGQNENTAGIAINAPFQQPYVERWAPLNFFDTHNSTSAVTYTAAGDALPTDIFGDLPIDFDSLRVRVSIERSDLVDGYGQLVLPGGTYPVLRERRTEVRSIRLDAKIGFLPWTDITDIILQNIPGDVEGLGRDTILRYYFWSDAIVTTAAIVTMENDQQTIQSVSFYDEGLTSSAHDPVADHTVVAFPNPAADQLYLSLSPVVAGSYTVRLLDVQGREVARQQHHLAGPTTLAMSVGHLPRGLYTCQLTTATGASLSSRRVVLE